MAHKPIEFRRLPDGLFVHWASGESTTIPARKLRLNCPCATCRERRGDISHAQPLTPKKSLLRIVDSSVEQELSLNRIWAVGNYALGLEWGDGHTTGIYTYELLWDLGQPQ